MRNSILESLVGEIGGHRRLMTIPYSNYNNDMCTDFGGILSSMNSTSGTRRRLRTFAAEMTVLRLGRPGRLLLSVELSQAVLTSSGRCQEPLTTICDTIKGRGINIAILYTTYLPITNNSWYSTCIAPSRSSIATQMKACTASGCYYEVSSDSGISAAPPTITQRG